MFLVVGKDVKNSDTIVVFSVMILDDLLQPKPNRMLMMNGCFDPLLQLVLRTKSHNFLLDEKICLSRNGHIETTEKLIFGTMYSKFNPVGQPSLILQELE